MEVKGTAPGSARCAVIVPCMNDGDLVLEAVGSLLGESEPLEIVVVDDGSDDPATLAALEQVEGAGVRVVRHPRNLGVSEARNTGMRATSAQYLLPLDSDDLIFPGALADMADRLDAEPAAAACFGDYIEFGSHLLIRGVPDRIDAYRIAFTNEYPASALFRRSVVEGLGGWRRVGRNIDARADWNLWMTLAEHYASGVHLGKGRFTYLRRVHHGRLAEAARRHHRQIYRELKAAHPRLFAELGQSRKSSELGVARRNLFPAVYGVRAWWPREPRVVRRLDQKGLWTLARPVHGEEAKEIQALVDGTRNEARARFGAQGRRSELPYDPASRERPDG